MSKRLDYPVLGHLRTSNLTAYYLLSNLILLAWTSVPAGERRQLIMDMMICHLWTAQWCLLSGVIDHNLHWGFLVKKGENSPTFIKWRHMIMLWVVFTRLTPLCTGWWAIDKRNNNKDAVFIHCCPGDHWFSGELSPQEQDSSPHGCQRWLAQLI